jgi:hypothetical protein
VRYEEERRIDAGVVFCGHRVADERVVVEDYAVVLQFLVLCRTNWSLLVLLLLLLKHMFGCEGLAQWKM